MGLIGVQDFFVTHKCIGDLPVRVRVGPRDDRGGGEGEELISS